MLVYSPMEIVLTFLINGLMRSFETQADLNAAQLGYGKQLQEGLLNLFLKNLADFNSDWLYSTYHNSHPTLTERLKALSEYKKAE